jgi:hypothetical protein
MLPNIKMTWRDKFGWRKLELCEIQPGMRAKLVIEKPWTEGAWVAGQKNKIFKVVSIDSVNAPEESITVDYKMSEGSGYCSEDHKHFVYQW